MDSPSDAEVIGRSLSEPEAFGLIYDRHAVTLLRFLGRRAGAKVAEGLVGELFRVAFERRTTFDGSRASALPWLYGIGSNLLLKHRRGEARRLRASARTVAGLEAADGRASAAALDARVLFSRVAGAIRGAAGRRARGAPALRVGGALVPERGRGARAADRHGAFAAPCGSSWSCKSCSGS